MTTLPTNRTPPLPDAKLPRLCDIIPIADRPKCFFCGKALRPYTTDVTDARHDSADFSVPPPAGEVAFGSMYDTLNDYQPDRVYKRCYRFGKIAWSYWTGRYRGYGRDKLNVTMFCTSTCAQMFAYAAVNGGYRMPNVEDKNR